MQISNDVKSYIKPVLTYVIACSIILLWQGCSDTSTATDTEDSPALSYSKITKVEELSREEILSKLGAFGELPPTANFLFRYGAAMYAVEYQSKLPDSSTVTLSATLTLPVDVDPAEKLRLLSYQHGTVFESDDVSSVKGSNSIDGLVAIIASSMGNITMASDYYGFGVSGNKIHPFVHQSLGKHSRDFIEVANHILDSMQVAKNDSLYLIGYSEGGYATLALQKQLDAQPVKGISLIASAPMAGPYDLSETMYKNMLESDTLNYPSYLPLTIVGYHSLDPLWNDPSEFFKSEFLELINTGFDGSLSGNQLNELLPTSAKELLTTEVYTELTTQSSAPLKLALANNDLVDYVPTIPTHFFHCSTDEIIPIENSRIAYNKMLAAGAPVELTEKEYGLHAECGARILLDGFFWLLKY